MAGTSDNHKYPNGKLDQRSLEQVNAYLDYELSEEEREQMRDLLAHSPAAENEMATLKATSKVLNELPPLPAPRSFAVRPAMLAQPRRRHLDWFGWWRNPSFALGLGSIAAACLLVAVLGLQLLGNSGKTSSVAYAPSGAAQPTASVGSTQSKVDTSNATDNSAPTYSTTDGGTVLEGQTFAPAAAQPPTPMTSAMAAATPTAEPPRIPATGAGAGEAQTPLAAPRAPTMAARPNGTFTDSSPAPAPSAPLPPTPTLGAMVAQGNSGTPMADNIHASGNVPNPTNQTAPYGVLPTSSIDYWLVVEISLAVLVVILGAGALIAQRRTRG